MQIDSFKNRVLLEKNLFQERDISKSYRSAFVPLAEPRVRQHAFVKIDHEVLSTIILSLPLILERRAVASFWGKNVYKYWLSTKRTKPDKKKCG